MSNQEVFVITKVIDGEGSSTPVLGVASSPDTAEKLIREDVQRDKDDGAEYRFEQSEFRQTSDNIWRFNSKHDLYTYTVTRHQVDHIKGNEVSRGWW